MEEKKKKRKKKKGEAKWIKIWPKKKKSESEEISKWWKSNPWPNCNPKESKFDPLLSILCETWT